MLICSSRKKQNLQHLKWCEFCELLLMRNPTTNLYRVADTLLFPEAPQWCRWAHVALRLAFPVPLKRLGAGQRPPHSFQAQQSHHPTFTTVEGIQLKKCQLRANKVLQNISKFKAQLILGLAKACREERGLLQFHTQDTARAVPVLGPRSTLKARQCYTKDLRMPCTAVLEVRPLGALLGFINHLL